ncbi:hypothetical protein SCYAM73S_01879 [Streptomyces cyaneofuscatus]
MTVPAPTTAPGTSAAMARIDSSAAAVRRVTSLPGACLHQRPRQRHGVGRVVQDDDGDDRGEVQYGGVGGSGGGEVEEVMAPILPLHGDSVLAVAESATAS